MRKHYSYILLGAALWLTPANGHAQHVLSPATAIALDGGGALKAADTAQGKGDKVSAFVTIDTSATSWQRLGLRPITCMDSTATVRLTAGELKALATQTGVRYIQLTSGARQMLDVARQEAGTDDVHNGVSLPRPYNGDGVVVGVVDAGFDYLHSAFRNPDDGSLRIKRVWEQTTASLEGAKAPEKYGYGIELDSEELIMASKGDTESNSHGTHVACIAAGSDDYKDGAFVGNAPGADIVLVALDLYKSTSADICNAVQYVFDYADSVGKPCVVNLSLGNHEGPHDGTSTFDTMTDKMQRAGHLIVGAAGNHRTDKFHIDHTFSSADDAQLRTFVNFKSALSTTNKGGSIEIWGEPGADFTVDVSAYSLFNKKDVVSHTVYPAEGVEEVSLDRYATGVLKVASEVSQLNGKPHVVLSSELTSVRNNYAIALTITPKNGCRVNVWADNSYLGLTSNNVEGFAEPDASSSTLAEIGGTGKRILTVGAYTTRNSYTTNTSSGTLNETVGDISSFSSYGPTADGRIKPDITAPGCFIISALSSNDSSSGLMYADWYDRYDHTNIYGYMQGTSMSSPFVAGIVATWLQAYPDLTPEQLHAIADETARKDAFAANTPDCNWGYGKINAMDGLKKCIEMKTAGCESIDSEAGGCVTVADGKAYIAFNGDSHASVCIASAMGDTILSKDLGITHAGETACVSLPNLNKGVYVITVRTAQKTFSHKFVCQ